MRRQLLSSSFPILNHSPWLHHLFLVPEDRGVSTDRLGLDGHALRNDDDQEDRLRFPDRMYGRSKLIAGRGPHLALEEEATVLRNVSKGVEKKSAKYGQILVVKREEQFFRQGCKEAAYQLQTDIVYFNSASERASPSATQTGSEEKKKWENQISWSICDLDLFRFSALTWNAHRIHWDRHFGSHHSRGLVVHGPLLGALALNLVLREIHTPLVSYQYDLVKPLLVPHSTNRVEIQVCWERTDQDGTISLAIIEDQNPILRGLLIAK